MSENLVREIHDAVADSPHEAQASVRPPGTTARQLAAMRRDVLRKLELRRDASVLEIGCGVGLLGVPVARRAASYTGVDFAPRAVEACRARIGEAGLADRARVLCLDIVGANEEQVRSLGRFDRILMYAVLHYARSEAEAVRFLERTAMLLADGGRALVGNVPLEDLVTGWGPVEPRSSSPVSRALGWMRWIGASPTSPVRFTRGWKARRMLELAFSAGARGGPGFVESRLPAAYTQALTMSAIEGWLDAIRAPLRYRWVPPGPGVPLVAGRADLIVERSP